jgi:hypothetical protein
MKADHCCASPIQKGVAERGRRPVRRRFAEMVRWLAPTFVLALIPKCPACLAAYVALGTGIGLSIPTANYMRVSLIGVCFMSLAYLTATRGRRIVLWARQR